MKKPEHQWETRLHRALRRSDRPARWADDGRAESFDLIFAGRVERAELGLEGQWVSAGAARDPDLEHAIACWLLARGGRRLVLEVEGQKTPLERELALDSVSDGPGVEAPRRIVTLAPSNAEVVEALGAFDRVVACEDSSDHPPEVADCERLGPDLGPDLERIGELDVDLVISSLTVPGMERIVTGLRARGIPQLVLAPKSLDDVVEDLRRTGRALHLEAEAEAAVTKFELERAELRARRSGPTRRVYLEWWPRPMFSPGRDCYSNELIELAGGHNVFSDRPGSSLEIEAAELIEADPELCFVSWCGVAKAKLDPQRLIARPGLEGLEAARKGRVFPLDEAFAGRPGPRVLEAARIMAAHIDELA